MNDISLNVVYIGTPIFPNGFAMTKRRRYMVDYMNDHNIQSHVLVCGFYKSDPFNNPQSGNYGICTYRDITNYFIDKNFLAYYREGKKLLKDWYVKDGQNALVLTSGLSILHFPFYRYAKKLGYKIVFDQVETSFIAIGGKMSLRRRVNAWIADKVTSYAMNTAASFVISSALQKLSEKTHPHTRLCLLPNASPSFKLEDKNKLHTPLRVLYSGTFAVKDGVDYLIDGAKEAVMNGCNLELIMMGKGQPHEMKVLEKLEGCNWAKYLGFVSDEELLNRIQNADVLCMTRNNSLFANYGFPFKLSEYLATGNILLATRVGDVELYVQDKKDAFVVDPENSKQIADALCYIQQHEAEAVKVANNGYITMQNKFGIESIGAKFIDFIKTL